MVNLFEYNEKLHLFVAELDSPVDVAKFRSAGWRYHKDKEIWYCTNTVYAARVAQTEKQKALVEYVKEKYEHPMIAASMAKGENLEDEPNGLFRFQLAGVEACKKAMGFTRGSVLLADEVRLGKTIETLRLIRDLGIERGKILIITTATAKLNWQAEYEKWLGVSPGVAKGGSFPDADQVVMNYDIASRHRASLIGKAPWDMIVIDECHHLKSRKTQRTKAILGDLQKPKAFPPVKARYKLALSGTPILSRPRELFPVLRYLDPHTFHSVHHFDTRYCGPSSGYSGRLEYNGASNEVELQYLLRSRLMVRRKKRDVLKMLPPVRQILPLEIPGISDSAKKFFDRAKDKAGINATGDLTEAQFEALRAVLMGKYGFEEHVATIRKAEAVAKVPYVIEHLEDLLEEGRAAICFVHHIEVGKAIEEHFRKKGVYPSKIVGGMTAESKKREQDRFQNGETPLLIGNLQAAGQAITLSRAEVTVFAEVGWTPGELEQAEERSFGFHKTEPIFVQYLVTAGGIDEHMLKMILRKKQTIDQTINRIKK
jgi:SWI/SNF-related matrix-associated actin-dependent regulator 1 of chromatin subfamily A